jgi:site-specific DNA-cytosine methylase
VNVGSLFSGPGLLDLGLAQAGHRHGWFVERDEHRRAILERRFPGVPVHDDVRTVGAHNLGRVDCIAGGFPCKGASSAGKRTGLAHPETALWAEFERVVRELRPGFVLVENVANLLSIHDGAVWGAVLGDLAALGYDVAWDCVPAAAVGAPHGRDRVFAFAAHADGAHAGRHAGQRGFANGWPDARGGAQAAAEPLFSGDCLVGNCWACVDSERGRTSVVSGKLLSRWGCECECHQAVADAGQRGRRPSEQHVRARQPDTQGIAVEWGEYEPAVHRWERIHGPAPEPLIRRMDDGSPGVRRMRARLDRHRLSALGDGVHVHVGRLVGEALAMIEGGD